MKLLLNIILLTASVNLTLAENITDFVSDGCSLFPDGTPRDQNLWCECCVAHDVAYWQGGTMAQKKTADSVLRDCILKKTDNFLLANTMYYGVFLGGSAVFPNWYRWGFGWSYGRGYIALTTTEAEQVENKLTRWRQSVQFSTSCDT